MIDTLSQDYSESSIIESILSLGQDWVIQKYIKCSKSISKIYQDGVCTFRIMTYRWKNDIWVCPAIMRIGIGGMQLDNVSLGGIFIGVDDNGRLFDYAVSKYGKRYYAHPDTNIVFKCYKIDSFKKVLSAAVRMHSTIPQVGIANWDFTIDENEEVVLIEGNLHFGGCWVFQMTGRSLFGEKTAEILQWVRRMRGYSIAEQKQHKFGF